MNKKTRGILIVMGLCVVRGMAANYLVSPGGASNWKNLSTWIDNSTGSYVASTVLPGAGDQVTVHGNRSLYVSDERAAAGFTCGMKGYLGTLYLHQPTSSLKLIAMSVGGNSGDGIVNQSNGSVDVAKKVIIGGESTLGEYNLSGGTLNMGAGSAITLNENGTMTVTGGSLNITATPEYAAINGAGKIELRSGSLNIAGGDVKDLFAFNTAFIEVSGGSVNLDAQLRLGNSTANDTELRVVGDAATISMLAINSKDSAGSTHGTFKFVLGEKGVSSITVEEWMFLSGSKLIVDGTAYNGGAQTITLFNAAGGLLDPFAQENIALVGFDWFTVSVEQNENGSVTLNIQ